MTTAATPSVTCSHTQVPRRDFTRFVGRLCQHYCAHCKRWLEPARFTPSRLHQAARVCRACARTKYSRTSRLSPEEHALGRIARQIVMRERQRGAPSPLVTRALVRRAIFDRFGCRSSLTDTAVALDRASLVRRDAAQPFDFDTNCALLTHGETRSLARLSSDASTDADHCRAVAAMRKRLLAST
jgi:hypothetical protein